MCRDVRGRAKFIHGKDGVFYGDMGKVLSLVIFSRKPSFEVEDDPILQRPSWSQGKSSFNWSNAVDNHPWRQCMIQSWMQGMSSLTWCTIHHSSLASIKHIDASSINPNFYNANHLGLNANNIPLWHWWKLESFFLPLWHQGQRVYMLLLSLSPPNWYLPLTSCFMSSFSLDKKLHLISTLDVQTLLCSKVWWRY